VARNRPNARRHRHRSWRRSPSPGSFARPRGSPAARRGAIGEATRGQAGRWKRPEGRSGAYCNLHYMPWQGARRRCRPFPAGFSRACWSVDFGDAAAAGTAAFRSRRAARTSLRSPRQRVGAVPRRERLCRRGAHPDSVSKGRCSCRRKPLSPASVSSRTRSP